MFDYFISHHNSSKELARLFYYNGIFNVFLPWYDESLLNVGDVMEDKITEGIKQSKGYLLIYSKQASESDWVKSEMEIAKNKKEKDPNFKILVLKIDSTNLNDFFSKYAYENWGEKDEMDSIIKIIGVLTGKEVISIITAASVLSSTPSQLFSNKTGSIAEHARNYLLLHLTHVKTLINSLNRVMYESELKDSLRKLEKLFIFESIPYLSLGGIPIGPGLFEFIHSNRMRIPPKVSVNINTKYSFKIIKNDEISTRIQFYDKQTLEVVNFPIPFYIEFDAEL